MGGGSGGGNSTTTTKADPWVGVQPYLKDAYSQLSELYNRGQDPQYYPTQTVTTPDTREGFGQQMLINATPQIERVGQRAAGNVTDLSNLATGSSQQGSTLINTGYGGMQSIAGQAQGGVGTANAAANQMLGYGNSGAIQAGNAFTGSAAQQLYNAGNFNNNPAFQAALQSAIRPVTQQYQETVLPSIRQGAQEAGQMGGSRQGIAEGLAARGYQDTVGDISANMGNQAYAQGLQALQASGQLGQGLTSQGLGALSGAGALGAGLGSLAGQLQTSTAGIGQNMSQAGMTGLGQATALAPGAQQGLTVPGRLIESIGQQGTADAQAQLDSQVARWNYNQNLPYTMLQDYLAQLNGGAALGGVSTAQQSGGGSNRMTGALGGAATGAAIGSVVPGIGTAIGAGAGALYGLFM